MVFFLELPNWPSLSPSPKELELMYKFLDTTNHVCKIQIRNANGELLDMPSSRAVWYTYCIVIVHYTITGYYWSLGIPYPVIQHFYLAGMIGTAPLPPTDDDKALLSPEEQKERLIWKFILTETWLSHQAHVPLKPSQRDANVISYPLFYWIFFYIKNFHIAYVK